MRKTSLLEPCGTGGTDDGERPLTVTINDGRPSAFGMNKPIAEAILSKLGLLVIGGRIAELETRSRPPLCMRFAFSEADKILQYCGIRIITTLVDGVHRRLNIKNNNNHFGRLV